MIVLFNLDIQVALSLVEVFKDLKLYNVIRKIYMNNQLPRVSFSKLKGREIEHCVRVFNIFPSSMLKKLQSSPIP